MGKTINLIRGTTNSFDIALKDETGAIYPLRGWRSNGTVQSE